MELWAGFILGLLGSFHCAGMCGPIALSLGLGYSPEKGRIWFSQGLYHLGKLLAYGSLGACFGMIGWSLNVAGFQRWVSLATGIGMILFVILSWMRKTFFQWTWVSSVFGKLRRFWGLLFQKKNLLSFFAIGFLNGFLPCGFVYLALATALTLGDIYQSILFMLFFGLGTVPMLASLVYFGHWMQTGFQKRVLSLMPLATFLLALLLIFRGLDLGIPYLSPKIQIHGSCCSSLR